MTSTATHIVDTSASFAGYFRQMSAKQTKSALSCFINKLQQEQAGKNSQYENDIRSLTERINKLPTTGGTGITDERLETLFVKLMQHEKFRQLFLGACQEIDGRLVSNSSLINQLINNPQPLGVVENYSPIDPTEKIGETWLLPADRSAVFILSDERLSEVGANPEIRKVAMTCNAYPFNGINATAQFWEKYAIYAPVNACEPPTIITLERQNMYYDFSGDLAPCPLTNVPDGIDINEDGRIGAAPTTEGTTPEVTDSATNPDGTVPEGTNPAANPEGTTPESTTPESTTPESTTPESTTPESTTPESTSPEVTDPATNPEGTDPAATPEGTTPEGTTPEGTTPEGTTPEGTTPEGTTPEGTTPEGTTPEGTTPEGTTPEGTTPEVTDPATNPEGTDPAITPAESNDPNNP